MQLDLDACEKAIQSSDQSGVVAHEQGAEPYVGPVKDALALAIEHSKRVYGWAPNGPICVHLFATDQGLLQGLQQLAGLPPEESRPYLGTFNVDLATNRPAIYLNTIISRGPTWVPFVATHEYFHIVQANIAGANSPGWTYDFPTWFIEGLADWEALKLQGDPQSGWLSVLISEERAGKSLSLSSLVAGWQGIEHSSPPYYKAKAALAYLEELAGPQAAAQILRANAGGGLSKFEPTFREITGVGLDEFEAGILPFLEDMIRTTSAPTSSP